MDKTTNKGMDPDDVALMIYNSVRLKRGNLVIAPLYMKATVILQTICPSIISFIMSRKAIKK